MHPFASAAGSDINARPHKARVVTEYLEQETIQHIDWLTHSTDINPKGMFGTVFRDESQKKCATRDKRGFGKRVGGRMGSNSRR